MARNRRLEGGKPLVRPGRSWPLDFASQEHVNLGDHVKSGHT
jgi:hypothetical protein